jgi:hypothetical protein
VKKESRPARRLPDDRFAPSVARRRDSLEQLGASSAFRAQLDRLAQLLLDDELDEQHGLSFGERVASLPERPT